MAKPTNPPRGPSQGGDNDRLGRSPHGSNAAPPAGPQGLTPSQMGASSGSVFPEDEPTPNEKAYGEPLIPMPLEGESAGVLGAGAEQVPEYIARSPGDHAYARYDGDPERELLGREAEEREITDEERLELFRMQMFQSQLPQLPDTPGFHICWLTTANPKDPIHSRLRLGYTLLRAVDFPGWEQTAVTGGEYQGVISINEMVAAKLPLRLYQLYMREAHHDSPQREEEKLRAQVAALVQQSAAQNARVHLDPSTAMLGVNTPRNPRFQ